MKLAVNGDLVFGMASMLPPMPFVGELGDEAAEAAERIAGGLRGPHNTPKAGPKLMVDGRRAATHRERAIELGPAGTTAQPLAWLGNISVGDRHILVHEGMFQCAPTGSAKSLALSQPIASAQGVVVQADPTEIEAAPGASGGADAAGSRADYRPATAMQTILSRVSSARLADLIPPEYAFLVGDPVDVVTGAVVTESTDVERLAPPFKFTRRYVSSRARKASVFGFGWSHNYDAALWLEVGRVVVRDRRGREIEFDCIPLPGAVARAGDELWDPTQTLRLRSHGRHHWELIAPEETLHFGPIPGTASADTDRGLAKLRKVVVTGQPLTELSYDAHARLQTIAVDGQTVVTLAYDHEDRIRSLNRDAAEFTYTAAGDLATATDADGNPRRYEYAGHLLVAQSNRRGGIFYYAYDGHGATARCHRTWGTGGRLHRLLSYDGDQTAVTDSLGHRTVYDRNAIGLVTGRSDARGKRTEFVYDDRLRLTEIHFPDGGVATDTYDEHGRLIKQRRPGGEVWRMAYDPAGRLVSGVDPVGGRWAFAYDRRGNLTRCSDPGGHVTRMEYEAGRLQRIIDPMGRSTEVRLGRGDEVTDVTTIEGAQHRFEYDAQGRLIRREGPAGEPVRWRYDACGRCSERTQGADAVRLHRDAEGTIVGVEDPTAHWVVRRDCFGTVTTVSDGTTELGYTHDTEGRLRAASRTHRSPPEGSPPAANRWECRRDERGNVTATVLDGRAECEVAREWASGRIERLAWAETTITLAWDEAGRLSSASDGATTRTFEYREDGLLAAFGTELGNSTLTRNARGVVQAQTHDGVALQSEHVDYAGNRFGLSIAGGASLSYLWTATTQLDRVAITGERTFDLSVDIRPDQAVVSHQGHTTTLPTPSPAGSGAVSAAPASQAETTTDALFRRQTGEDGQRWIWDEDRLLLDGETLRVSDPRSGLVLARIAGETLTLATPGESTPAGPRPSADLEADARAHATLFPALPTVGGEGPIALLRGLFRARVWDPRVRPLPGEHPWDPDAWSIAAAPDADGPTETRLDLATLLRLLSPFPRRPLRPQAQPPARAGVR